MSAGLRAAGGAWNRVLGVEPTPPRAAKRSGRSGRAAVIELRDYRAATRKLTAVDARAQEVIVEETQSCEAVVEAPPPGARAGEVFPPAAEDEIMAAPVEARESDHGEGEEGDDRDGGDEPEPGDSPQGGGAATGEPAADGQGEGEDGSVEGERLDSILESLLLAAGSPLTVRRMCDAIRSGPKAKEVRSALARLKERYSGDCGVHLLEVAGGSQFRTAAVNVRFVRNLLREKPARLGRAALETLSIIAYKQPATRGDIEAIRGVDADSAVNTLLSKRLIKIDGRRETVGRPLLYSTTPEFLEIFGLKDLKELPTLKEIGPVPEPENEQDIEEEGFPAGDVAQAIVGAAADAGGEAADLEQPSGEEIPQSSGQEVPQPSGQEGDGQSGEEGDRPRVADAEAISREGAGGFDAGLADIGQEDVGQEDVGQEDVDQDDIGQDDGDGALEEDGGGAEVVAGDAGEADGESDAEAGDDSEGCEEEEVDR